MKKRRNASRGGSLRWFGWVLMLALLAPATWAKSPRSDQKTEVKVVSESVKIEPPTLFETNRRLPPRQRVLVQQGEPGEKRIEWRITLRNGKEVKREKVSEEVVQPPQPRIYEVGVYAHIASRGAVGRGNSFRAVKTLEMNASAYTAHRSGGGTGTGRTASGMPAGYGMVAVDPKVIPFGTVLYIEGYGMAIAADKGRAIRGHKIDLFFATRAQALQFGRRRVRVHILRPAPVS